MTPEERKLYENPDAYRVHMNGRWELEDLYQMPHAFEQCYSFIYCFDAEVTPLDPGRIDVALQGYPWRGGYSYLNIYTVLKGQVLWRDRPRVNEIKYASPGWVELTLAADVAIQVAKAISALAAAGAVAAKSYAAAYKFLADLKVYREKNKIAYLTLTKEQDQAILALCDVHAKHLGFKSTAALVKQTGNSEVTLRLLLAHHRRLRELALFSEEGKATFPIERKA